MRRRAAVIWGPVLGAAVVLLDHLCRHDRSRRHPPRRGVGIGPLAPRPRRDAAERAPRRHRVGAAAPPRADGGGRGAGLALCGAVMQAITRNPLADPYLLGLSSGASLGAVSVVLLGVEPVAPGGCVRGLAGGPCRHVAARQRARRHHPHPRGAGGARGVGLAGAITSLVIFWTATGDSYREILGWLLGSLASARWSAVAIAGIAVLVIGIPIMFAGRTLDAFAFGDTAAASSASGSARHDGVCWLRRHC